MAWGLNPPNAAAPLGLTVRNEPAFIAKFRETDDYWSGYPADYRNFSHDRPATSVLVKWRDAGIIAKHEIAKIRGGQRCSLSV